ncbi:UNVERIFIED_CONTAM: hypothetical protein RF648_19845, partial [Kocuria sp. CPCC 205274]
LVVGSIDWLVTDADGNTLTGTTTLNDQRTFVIDKDSTTDGTYTAGGKNVGTISIDKGKQFKGTFHESGNTGTGYGSSVQSNSDATKVTASFSGNVITVDAVDVGQSVIMLLTGNKDALFQLTVNVT